MLTTALSLPISLNMIAQQCLLFRESARKASTSSKLQYRSLVKVQPVLPTCIHTHQILKILGYFRSAWYIDVWYIFGIFLSECLFEIKLVVILQSANRETMKPVVLKLHIKNVVILFNMGESVHFG